MYLPLGTDKCELQRKYTPQKGIDKCTCRGEYSNLTELFVGLRETASQCHTSLVLIILMDVGLLQAFVKPDEAAQHGEQEEICKMFVLIP